MACTLAARARFSTSGKSWGAVRAWRGWWVAPRGDQRGGGVRNRCMCGGTWSRGVGHPMFASRCPQRPHHDSAPECLRTQFLTCYLLRSRELWGTRLRFYISLQMRVRGTAHTGSGWVGPSTRSTVPVGRIWPPPPLPRIWLKWGPILSHRAERVVHQVDADIHEGYWGRECDRMRKLSLRRTTPFLDSVRNRRFVRLLGIRFFHSILILISRRGHSQKCGSNF
jgi:hypothetical protein